MRNSRSIRNRWLVVFATLVLWVGVAHAERRRVVVLDFEGENAEKIHSGVIKLIKKQHTVVSVKKWNSAAADLNAEKVTEKNVKKLAKKLKVDAIVTGRVDKRRDEYIIKLRLRSGVTGELTGKSVQTKSESAKLDSQSRRDIKDELLPVIESMESNRGGGDGGDDGDEPVASKKDDDDGKKSGFSRKKDDDDDKPKKKKQADKRNDDEEAALATKRDDDDRPKRRKRKASADDEGGDEEEGIEESFEEDEESGDAAARLSPARRAIDAALGLSFTRRNLAFEYESMLGNAPPGYRQSIPVAGALIDLTFYPLAIGQKKPNITTNFGVNVLYDQVIKISSKKSYIDEMGNSVDATLGTKESRWLVGAVFRYPLGKLVVGGALSYGKQHFEVDDLPGAMPDPDIPSVAYTMFTPSVFVRFPVIDKLILNADAGFHAITNTGEIQTRTQYGAATVSGYDLEAGLDYMVTKNIFARASVRYQGIGFTFKGDPMSKTHTRDTDVDQDVTGAKDTYFGGTATLGYVY